MNSKKNEEIDNIKNSSFLTRDNGVKSSKRLLGVIMLAWALLYGGCLGLMSIFGEIKNPDITTTVLQYFILGGCTLLGVGVFEGNKKIK